MHHARLRVLSAPWGNAQSVSRCAPCHATWLKSNKPNFEPTDRPLKQLYPVLCHGGAKNRPKNRPNFSKRGDSKSATKSLKCGHFGPPQLDSSPQKSHQSHPFVAASAWQSVCAIFFLQTCRRSPLAVPEPAPASASVPSTCDGNSTRRCPRFIGAHSRGHAPAAFHCAGVCLPTPACPMHRWSCAINVLIQLWFSMAASVPSASKCCISASTITTPNLRLCTIALAAMATGSP